MPSKRKTLGRKELELLHLVSELEPATVRAVAERASQARTTVLTVMERLRAKGFLSRDKVGGVYHYKSRVPRSELLRDLVGEFVDGVLGGSLSPFVAYLAEGDAPSKEDMDQLRALVSELEQRSTPSES